MILLVNESHLIRKILNSLLILVYDVYLLYTTNLIFLSYFLLVILLKSLFLFFNLSIHRKILIYIILN